MRLIDADAMKRVYQEVLCSHVACIDCSFFMDDKYCRFETMLSEAPTINAVPVIRCRECRYRFKNNGHDKSGCPIIDANIWMDDDDFCSHGERKEGADND